MKMTLALVWAWLRDTLWPFVKKHWKAFAAVLALVAAAVVVKNFFAAIIGAVQKPANFAVVDATHIAVREGNEWVVWQLPTGVSSREVTAAGVDAGGKRVVEVDNNVLQGVPS